MKRNATRDMVLGNEESGPHFCLGANLARREIAIALGWLLQAFPDIEVCGPVSKSGSLFLNVVTNLPVRYTPT